MIDIKHLDITIDFESCGLTASSAPMMVALVPWLRDADAEPFLMDDAEPLVMYVDLRTCVVDGFDFDPQTLRWWSRQSQAAREAVTRGLAEPVQDVLVAVVNYLRLLRERFHLNSICLWSQGELDIAMLRYMATKYDIPLDDIIFHTQQRDARTVILEAALALSKQTVRDASMTANTPEPYLMPNVLPDQILAGSYDVYKMFAPLPDRYTNSSVAHDALYDALRTSWNTWQALRWLGSLITNRTN